MPDPTDTAARVLVVDDEADHADVMCEALDRLGHRCETAHSLDEARRRLARAEFDVVVTDLRMDGEHDGLALLAETRRLDPPPVTVLVTAVNDVPTSKAALAAGAYDYIVKPLDLDEFRAVVGRAAAKARAARDAAEVETAALDGENGFEGIVGRSAAIKQVVRTARQVAPSDLPVLVLGESGTGKELVARAIHRHSKRRKARLVALNCAGLSESILEDELFGHVRGAYTGAQSSRAGRFEHADGGTLFMDEIGDMPAAMQAKLLRVLEGGEVVRLGSNDPIRVDVRLVSATNRDIVGMVERREFREDLFFRIKGVTITLPPLRDRREDVPLLVHHFVKLASERHGRPAPAVTPEALRLLTAYGWPGNVRQLKSTVENLIVLGDAGTIDAPDLPPEINPAGRAAPDAGGMDNLVGISLEAAEKELIRNTLKLTDGNREQAARQLGIGERTLYRKIKEYALS